MCLHETGILVLPSAAGARHGRHLRAASLPPGSERERPCLKGIEGRVMEQDTQYPLLPSACGYGQMHLHTHNEHPLPSLTLAIFSSATQRLGPQASTDNDCTSLYLSRKRLLSTRGFTEMTQ